MYVEIAKLHQGLEIVLNFEPKILENDFLQTHLFHAVSILSQGNLMFDYLKRRCFNV